MKKQSQKRIAQLKAQYPVINEYLRLSNHYWKQDQEKDKIYIEVRRCDENLLLRQPDLLDGKSSSATASDHPGMSGTVHEVISTVSADHKLISTIGNWSVDYASPKSEPVKRVRQLFDKSEPSSRSLLDRPGKCSYQEFIRLSEPTDATVGGMLRQPPAPVAYLVSMVVVCWYVENKELRKQRLPFPWGEFVERAIHIVVYRAPKEGFASLLGRSDITKHMRLNMSDLHTAISGNDPTLSEALEQLRDLRQLFVDRTYVHGLSAVIQNSTSRGMSGMFGSTKLMSCRQAGALLLTFSKGDDDFTLIGNDDGAPRLGIQSINATVVAARAMVEEVIALWERSPLPENERFRDDDKLSIGL